MTFWFWTETKKGVTDFDQPNQTSDYKQLPSLFIKLSSTKETKEKGKDEGKNGTAPPPLN